MQRILAINGHFISAFAALAAAVGAGGFSLADAKVSTISSRAGFAKQAYEDYYEDESYPERRSMHPYLKWIDQGAGIIELTLDGPVYQLPEDWTGWLATLALSPRHAMQAVKQIRQDPSVLGVRVKIKSPGGTVCGTGELARALREMASEKYTVVTIDELCASAGYWIAAGCGLIVSAPSADVGCIGVYAFHLNLGKTYEAFYETDLTLIYDGDRKAEMLRAMDDKMKSAWALEIQTTGIEFRDWVAFGRGREIAEEFLQGQCVTGVLGLQAGLVDFLDDDPAEFALTLIRENLAIAA